MTAEDHYLRLLDHLPEAKAGNMFGYPCLKLGRKPFVFRSIDGDEGAAFKLGGAAHEAALELAGATLFNPANNGKPMRNWVLVPPEHHARWPELAVLALNFLTNETR